MLFIVLIKIKNPDDVLNYYHFMMITDYYLILLCFREIYLQNVIRTANVMPHTKRKQ